MEELVNGYLLKEHHFLLDFVSMIRREMGLLRNGHLVDLEKYRKILMFGREYADQVHHGKEEGLLFTRLYPISNIEGGPRCIYYKELQMQRTPVFEQVREIQKWRGEKGIAEKLQWKDQTREGHIVNPLLEEHVLGRELLSLIEFEVKKRVSGEKGGNVDLIRALYRYANLLQEHIEKENTCFANTVDQYLSVEVQREIIEGFRQMDEGPARDRILASMEIFKELKAALWGR